MKPTPKSQPDLLPLLAFGAHPDDIEFGCGGVIAREVAEGRSALMVVCSLGESASHGTPKQRKLEAENAAGILGAAIEFIEIDGDAHLEFRVAHAIKLAAIIRRAAPGIVLSPSTVENQHPDHAALGKIVSVAARMARYGGVKEMTSLPKHEIDQLLFYAITPDAEPRDINPIFVDVSEEKIMAAWKASMDAHASQLTERFPSALLVFDSLRDLKRSARRF
jgi:LmbE family N-acetylglucosaminyl deacetylase